jgi:hypothetical protein
MKYSTIIIRWSVKIKFKHIDLLEYIDDFKLNEDWAYLEFHDGKRVTTFGYEDKMPRISEHLNGDGLILFNKYQIYKLYERYDSNYMFENYLYAETISSTKPGEDPIIDIPGLEITSVKYFPYTSLFKFEFDYHVMLTIIDKNIKGDIINDSSSYLCHRIRMKGSTQTKDRIKDHAFGRAVVSYDGLMIEVVENALIYSGDNQSKFYDIAQDLQYEYEEESGQYLDLFSLLDGYECSIPCLRENDIDHPHHSFNPRDSYFALDYEVWYKGARENQRIWPIISKGKINIKSVKFNNCWYTPYNINEFVHLSRRYDDNPYGLIPKIYKRDSIIENKIPISVSSKLKELGINNKILKPMLETEDYDALVLDGKGEIVECSLNPKYVLYDKYILHCDCKYNINNDVPNAVQAQLLDKRWKRTHIMVNNKWIESLGIKIRGIISIPWYYRQIAHDYAMYENLNVGDYTDMMNIGIVRKDATPISMPSVKTLYVGETSQTRRLRTFKYKYNVYVKKNVLE